MTPCETGPSAVVLKALHAASESARLGGAGDEAGGITPAFVAAPASTAEASALLRAAAEHDLAVVPRGSGSRLGWGTPPSRCDLVVDMLGMGQVIEHAAGDLVARVQAGARMGDIAAMLGTAGQEIALDVPATATAGGVIADALAGPRRLRYGSPRDLLIGITIVRADGTVARAGGKVVKNVAGYDLGKLFAGSAGTLGLITEATFRLHPLPAARAWVTAGFPGPGGASVANGASDAIGAEAGGVASAVGTAVAAAANSPLVASAVELHRPEPGGHASVSVLLEGSADGVAARAREMARLLGQSAAAGLVAAGASTPRGWPASVSGTAPDWWGGVPDPGDGTLLRVTFWVSALSRVLAAIDTAARETGLHPAAGGSAGAGVLYVTLPGDASAGVSAETPAAGPGPAAVARFAGLLRAAIPAGRGSVAVLTAPEAVRTALGASGIAGEIPGAALMRAVKAQFDPDGRLSPGRLSL